jgi:hypothetical protein
MTQYILKTLDEDYYSSWTYQGFVSHLTPETIVKMIKERIVNLKDIDTKITEVSNDNYNNFPDAIYDNDLPDGTLNEVNQLCETRTVMSWMEFGSKTYIRVDTGIMDHTIEILALSDYFASICKVP